MTEDDAKTKWCPFSRVLSQTYTQQGEFRASTGYSYNRTPDGEESYFSPATNCIGSACMAWRWTKEPLPAVVDDAVDGEGYCGLAGAP